MSSKTNKSTKSKNKVEKQSSNQNNSNYSDDSDNLSSELNQLSNNNSNFKKEEIKEIKSKQLTSEEVINNIYVDLNATLQSNKCESLTGEIITFRYSDPNAYITIKILDYQINGIFWSITKSKNIQEYKKLEDGDKVKIHGNFSISKKNLSIYFNIKSNEKIGLGDYLQLHNQMRNKIIELGWDKDKLKLTKFPYNIGIVTAIEGAAIQDILQTFRTDNFVGNIHIINAIVQGKSCPNSVIQAIEFLELNHPNLDLVLVTRGGGSYEDLVGFSDWDLVTKIKNTNFITMSAIGHQIDNQLSDEVADYKFPTPTFAAKFIVETQKRYFNKYYQYKDLVDNVENKYNTSKINLIYIVENVSQIIENYNIKEYKEKLYKFSSKINQILNKYNSAKKSYYNFITNMKPTIIKNGIEVTSINQLLEAPKKMDIILLDGGIKVSYKVLDQNL